MAGQIKFSPYFTVLNVGGDILVDVEQAAVSAMSYSDWAFGFSCNGAVDTVNGGDLNHGTRTPIAVAGVAITIPADQTWVYVTYPFGGGAASIISSTTKPQITADTFVRILHLVTLTNGVASVAQGNIKYLGDITIPGSFA